MAADGVDLGQINMELFDEVKDPVYMLQCLISAVLLYGKKTKEWATVNILIKEKEGLNRGRRKVDISAHVGWELVGKGALYLTCDEGKTKVRGWLSRS